MIIKNQHNISDLSKCEIFWSRNDAQNSIWEMLGLSNKWSLRQLDYRVSWKNDELYATGSEHPIVFVGYHYYLVKPNVFLGDFYNTWYTRKTAVAVNFHQLETPKTSHPVA